MKKFIALLLAALLIIGMMWVRPQGLIGASNSMLAGGKIKVKEEKKKGGDAK